MHQPHAHQPGDAVDQLAQQVAAENARFNATAPPDKKRMVNLRKLRHRLRKQIKAKKAAEAETVAA